VSEKRRGLGRGLGALIPSTTTTRTVGDRPVDVFFPGRTDETAAPEAKAGSPAEAPTVAPVAPRTEPTVDLTAPAPAPDEMAGATPAAGSNGTAAADGFTGNNDLLPVPGARFAELPVLSIRPNPRQPRTVFDEEALAELVHSVKEIGVLQPVVVRQVADEDGEPRYELIMGERRWRATQEAGLDRIPAIIRETSDDVLLRDALLENLHRSQLNPLEEAAAYQQLLDDFGCTHEELATRIGRSRPQISNTIRLLRLPPLVQRRVAAGVLSAGHARALLGLDDTAGMERLAQRIVAEGLSVRAVEEIVALGDGPVAKPVKKRPRAGAHTSELDDLASRLGDKFDTRVTVALGRSRGRLSIDFASVDDLNRIVGLMAPDLRKAFQEAAR
jgi:ParB family transcriptional regulator, chromosome partitioning protein